MAKKYVYPPRSLRECTKEDVQELITTTERNFAADLFGQGNYNTKLTSPVTSLDGKFHWSTNSEFLRYITDLTQTEDVRSASNILYSTLTKVPKYEAPTMTGAPESSAATVPSKAQREVQEEELTSREARIKTSVDKAKSDVEAEIQRQEKLREKLQETKVKVKVEEPKPAQLNEDEQAALNKLREAAQKSPKQLYDQIEPKIETRLRESVAGASDQQISAAAKVGAYRTLTELRGQEKLVDNISIATAVVQHPQVVVSSVADAETFEQLKNTAERVIATQALEYKFDWEISSATFGESFTENVFGPKNLDLVRTTFSSTPQEGYKDFDLSSISNNYTETLTNDNFVLQNVEGFATDKIQSKILGRIGTWAESKLPQGFVEQALSNKAIVAALDIFGVNIGPSIAWEGTTMFGRLAISTGYGPVVGWIGEFTGINLGVSMAATSVATEVAGETIATAALAGTETLMTAGSVGASTIAGIGVEAATTTLAGAAAGVTTTAVGAGTGVAGGAAAGAAAGSIVPGPGTAVGAVIGAIGGIVAGIVGPKAMGWIKNNSRKIGQFALAGVAAMFGFVAGGFTGAAIGAGLGIGASALMQGGLPGLQSAASSVASGVSGATGAIWNTFLQGMAAPILIFLLAFPLVVTLIIFIINSGAYIVPPGDRGTLSGGGLVSLCKETEARGADITDQLASRIKNGSVYLLPQTVFGRVDGLCITPTMIIMHWSDGTNDNPEGNLRTYETLVTRNLSCQLATDTNDTILMERFFEKQVEFPACARPWNDFSINNEMAGTHFTANPPPPNLDELELTYDATCKVMKQYNIPWTQIYGHYEVPHSRKTDPGEDFLQKVFIPEIKRRCPNGN